MAFVSCSKKNRSVFFSRVKGIFLENSRQLSWKQYKNNLQLLSSGIFFPISPFNMQPQNSPPYKCKFIWPYLGQINLNFLKIIQILLVSNSKSTLIADVFFSHLKYPYTSVFIFFGAVFCFHVPQFLKCIMESGNKNWKQAINILQDAFWSLSFHSLCFIADISLVFF